MIEVGKRYKLKFDPEEGENEYLHCDGKIVEVVSYDKHALKFHYGVKIDTDEFFVKTNELLKVNILND